MGIAPRSARALALLLLLACAAAGSLDSASGTYGLDGSATTDFVAATPVFVGNPAHRGLLQDAPADMQGAGVGGDALQQAVKAVLKEGGVPKFGDKGQRVFTCIASSGELELLRNWAVLSRKSHIPHVSVIALDTEVAAAAERMGLIVFSVPKLLPSLANDKESARVAKASITSAIVSAGHDVLLSEPDVAWVRDPALYLSVYDMAAADVLVSSECMYHFLERPLKDPATGKSRDPIDFKMDLGVVVIKSTEIGIKFAAAWAAAVVADKAKTADAVFNELMRMPSAGQASPQNVDTLQPIPGGSWAVARMQDLFPRYQARVNDGSQPRVFWVHPLRVGLGILPVGLFTNGHTYFIGDMPGSFRLKPYTVHASTHVSKGTDVAVAVKSRLRSAGLWNDPEEYYTEGSFLVLDLDPPADMLDSSAALALGAGGKPPAAHQKLMAWQLDLVRDGFALAEAMNRTLVLPKLFCLCDHSSAEGEATSCKRGEMSLPFECPVDHAFDAAALDRSGLRFRFRKFMQHPRVTLGPLMKSLKHATQCGAAPLVSCEEAKKGGAAALPTGAKVEEARKALEQETGSARIVRVLVRAAGLVGGIDAQAERDAFNKKVAPIAGEWCCGKDGGGVKYKITPYAAL